MESFLFYQERDEVNSHCIDLKKATSLATGIFSDVVWLHIGAKWIKHYNAG